MAVSKRLRYEVLRRDNHACRYCGAQAPEATLVVDHVMPVALGGADKAENLVAACRDCNAGKSASNPDAHLVSDVADDAIRWASAIELASKRQKRAAQAEWDKYIEFVNHMADVEAANPAATFPNVDSAGTTTEACESINQFLRLGLEMDDLHRSIEAAMTNRRLSEDRVWKYFCGICWRKIDALHEAAAAIIEAGDV